MMQESLEKQKSDLLQKFIQKDIREKILGVTIKQKPSHYFGKTANSTHKNRTGSLHICHNITHKALCNQKLNIVEKVDLFESKLPVCKSCLRVYENFKRR